MVAKLEPRDALFTFDRTSLMSKVIARVTHGPYSHCAIFLGDGQLSEVVTSETRIAPLDIYKDRKKYLVSAYRHLGHLGRSKK